MNVGVLGAGALGLAAGYRMATLGHAVTVIEREHEVGGLAAGFPVGQSYLEKFYHHIFRSDRYVVGLAAEVGLGSAVMWRQPRTSILSGGRSYRLDSPLSVLAFRPLAPWDRLRLGAAMAYLKGQRDYRRFEGQRAADWIGRWMGPRVYQKVWGPLLEAKFGRHYREVGMPWFWSRVHLRSASLGYLQGGFQRLYERLALRVQQRGGEVRLGETVTRIAVADRPAVETDQGSYAFDRLLVTLPTRVFCRLAVGLPGSYERAHDPGEALAAHSVILALDRPFMSPTYWLNVADPGFPFLAAVEHTSFAPPEDYGGRHLLYLGNYLPTDHPRFAMSKEGLLEEYLPAMARLNRAFRPEWVQESWLFKAPFAQPVVDLGYRRRLPSHATPLPGVFLANMFQVYPEDRGQNYSIKLAERVVPLVLR